MPIYYQKGYKYQLIDDFEIQTCIKQPYEIKGRRYIHLTKDGLLTIRAGYAWDGPSGPTIDTKTFMRGALVHDALYQLMRLGTLSFDHRETADRELRRICLEDGMWRIRAWYVYRAVRRLAGMAALPKNIRAIHVAP